MLTNTEIKQLLKKHKGDKIKLATFLEMPVSTLDDRLNSDEPKNNLDGQYKKFLIEQKR